MRVPSLDELRTWPNERLLAARDAARERERRARLARVRMDRVLDERGAMGGRAASEWVAARDRTSSRSARDEVAVARALEDLPAIRALAEAGRLSMDQLVPLVELATPETDAEWAQRAEHLAPSELRRLLRKSRVVSAEEMAERRAARAFRWWRTKDGHGLRLAGTIFDVDAAFVEAMLEHEIETMRPAKGQPWDSRAHRGADALAAICRRAHTSHPAGDAVDASAKKSRARKPWQPTVVVHVGSDAQPTVNGMPIDVATVDDLIRAGAKVRTVHDDDPLAPRSGDRIPAALRTYLAGRDATCRVPGCERTFGLDAHHLVPRSWGGATDKHNLVLVCTTHHRTLVPHGRWLLSGDPEAPDRLTHTHVDTLPDARAGPHPEAA